MLDSDTKRRIDTARDILVGKVPDPKSQVEQITIALIYKFMGDMDAESEEFGGKRSFFAGEFARYGWTKLMRAGLGGHETLNLYAEAIAKMPENPGIPRLFRDIFNNAYLPYRDPETLRAFLKIIDEFTYDHSERLGDAFEYLLSVLGSQGDAGQFRTPRHIIDFIVAIIDPKKGETVLDPACGTAGFLISSYKHILAANTDPQGGSTLTPDDKGRLAANFKGYDISPDMVRLSLVNLYLHGFADPHIFEYDTLTSEERWNEYADVILANPPFMSPKGGIRPHNRFSVQSKRSEVLFVDYMAEHLMPSGRAGIIVPEGIIFQSQNAYKQLRKMLVEEYLVAVVSLPAGVFNPYSGVKTSILILDKSLAKKTDRFAFFKVENDGFGLGAQRRKIDKDDLPQVQAEIGEYLRRLRAGESLDAFEPTEGIIVEKGKLAADEDCNLSGERYRESQTNGTKYGWVELGEIILGNPQYGSGARKVLYDGRVRYVRITDLTDRGELKPDNPVSPSSIQPKYFLEPGDLLIARSGSVGRMYLHRNLLGTYQYAGYLIRFRIDPDKALPEYVFHVSQSDSWQEWISNNSRTGTLTNINAKQYSSFRLPLPPLEMQKEVVAEIEGYQKVIDGARAVVDNYRPHITIDPDWPMVELGDVCSLGGTITTDVDFSLPYFGADSIESNTGKLVKSETAQDQKVSGPVYEFTGERLLYSKIRPYLNKLAVVDLRGYCSSDMYPLLPNHSKVRVTYLAAYMLSEAFNECIRGYYERASIPKINRSQLFGEAIPLPPLETQQQIVAEIEAEQALVAANRELIERFEKKISAAIGRVWGEAEPDTAEA